MEPVSKKNEDESERQMRQVLEHEGFRVIRIPSTSTKTADFRVSDDEHNYLVFKQAYPLRFFAMRGRRGPARTNSGQPARAAV